MKTGLQYTVIRSMFTKIFVPLDGSPSSEAALPVAIDAARRYGAEVQLAIISLIPTMYHTIDENVLRTDLDSCRAYIEKTATRMREANATVPISTYVGEGAPAVARALLRRAGDWGADLIIMSSHGHGSIERLILGSVAERMAHAAHIPIMLVHSSIRSSIDAGR